MRYPSHTLEWLFSKASKMTITGGKVGKLESHKCWWEGDMVQPLWKTAWSFALELKI
jgi:hypothetical protein